MSELGPPPPPKKVNMPVMTEADKKRLSVSSPRGGAAPPPPPPMMMGSPMMAGSPMGGYPTIGGMGPNLVFNFYQPYGMAMAAAAEEVKVEEVVVEEGSPPLVQGDPTWCQPRTRVKKGEPLKNEPCVIM